MSTTFLYDAQVDRHKRKLAQESHQVRKRQRIHDALEKNEAKDYWADEAADYSQYYRKDKT